MPRTHTMIAILACILVPLAMLEAQPQKDAIVEQIDDAAGAAGLSRVAHHLYRDWLNRGTHQLVGFDLDASVPYVLLGACDADCGEIHFTLFDRDGNALGRTGGSSSRPILSVEPPRSGRYQLRASMRQCSLEPCEWGVRVYRR
jgi:hypothetical protein